MNRLDGKSALISGAAIGTGAATARMMETVSAKVIFSDILEERRAVAAEIVRTGCFGTVEDVTRAIDSSFDAGSSLVVERLTAQ